MTAEQLLRQYRFIAHLMESMTRSWRAKVEYHVLAAAIYWNDELPPNLDWLAENSMRPVLRYRTSLLLGKPESQWEPFWVAAKIAFPRWIGFRSDRCTSTKRLVRRIGQMENQSNEWIDGLD